MGLKFDLSESEGHVATIFIEDGLGYLTWAYPTVKITVKEGRSKSTISLNEFEVEELLWGLKAIADKAASDFVPPEKQQEKQNGP